MIDIIINLLTAIINILPMSPFNNFISQAGKIDGLAILNWFIPFDIFLVMLEAWGVCMGLYYLYRLTKGTTKNH